MKSVCLLTRRAGTTREAFRDYYETQHCRLGMKYFPFAKYLRNHVSRHPRTSTSTACRSSTSTRSEAAAT